MFKKHNVQPGWPYTNAGVLHLNPPSQVIFDYMLISFHIHIVVEIVTYIITPDQKIAQDWGWDRGTCEA